MQPHVELRPEHLHQARLRARCAGPRRAGSRSRTSASGTPRRRSRPRRAGRATSGSSPRCVVRGRSSRCAVGEEAARGPQREAALRAGGRHRDAPTLVGLAEHVGVGRRTTSSKNTSAKPSSPSSRSTGRTVTPGVERSTRKYVRPWCRSAVGIAAEQTEEMRAERAARRPRLLTRQPPAAGRVVARRLRLDAREVAARVRLRPPLAPGLFAGCHLREDAVLLLRGAELEDRRREQEDAVLRHALRRTGARSTPPRRSATPTARVPAAVRFRPRHHRVPRRRRACAPIRGARRSPPACRPTATGGGERAPSSHARHSARNASSAGVNVRSMGLVGAVMKDVGS